MIERDDELKRILEKWETPGARPGLDARVWHSYRETKRARARWKVWGAIAAGVVLAVGAARVWSPGPGVPENADWQPLPDGAITVVRMK